MTTRGLADGGNRANLVTTVAGFAASLFVGFWFTPYLVHRLGAAAFGLIPLATTIVSYFSLLTQSLSATLTRSLSLALGVNDHEKANHIFGTVLGASLVLCGIAVAPLGIVALLSPKLFHVPGGMQTETQVLFGIVGVNFLLSLITTCFAAVAFSRNKIYLNNIAGLAQSLVRIGVTFAIFSILGPRVFYAALAILISAIVSFALSIQFAKRSVPWLRLSGIVYDPGEFKGFFRISSHQMVMQLGTVIIMSCEIVLANRLFGHYDAGRYAAAIQWLLFLRNAAMTLVVLFVPTMFALYARSDLAGLIRYVQRAMRWVGICVALPTGYLCALSPQVLTVWLGPEYRDLWVVMTLQLAPLAAVSCVLPLYTISLAADRVLVSAAVQLLTGVVGIALATVAVDWGGQGMAAIAVCVGWTLALKEIGFMPVYAASNISAKPTTFYAPIAQSVALYLVALALFYIGGKLFQPTNYLTLALVGVVFSVPYAAAAVMLSPREDREVLAAAMARARLRLSGIPG